MPRRWSSEEVHELVENVETHYDFLTSALTISKTKSMVDNKWLDITDSINALGTGPKLEVEKVKKKWFDMKSTAKKAVAEYKKELTKTGGGANSASTPTELQFKIASFIGPVYTEGIPETENCDVASAIAATSSSPQSDGMDSNPAQSTVDVIAPTPPLERPTGNATVVSLSSSVHAAKRPRLSKRESQNEEIIQAEQDKKNAVIQIAYDLQTTNAVLLDIAKELKTRNRIEEQRLLIAELESQQQNYLNVPELNYNN